MSNKRRKSTWLLSRKRLITLFGLFSLVLLLLCVRLGYIQIVKGGEYSKMAAAQQITDEVVEANRGDIRDTNGQILAQSAKCYSIWVRPSVLEMNDTKAANAEQKDKVTEELTKILDLDDVDSKELRKDLDSDKNQIKVVKYMDRDVADKVREAQLAGVSITEETKRYYPMGKFAAHLLGSVTDDNNGLSGIEQYYNKYLKGVAGRWIKNTDSRGNALSYGSSDYYDPVDGATVQLTVDEVIQHYTEKSIKKVMKQTSADRVSCLVMNPETGEVLAMASTPEFNPNNARVAPGGLDKSTFEAMSEKEQLKHLNKTWRNPLVSDTYEPGSTFKLLTTSAALEENLTNRDEHFVCNASINVAGAQIRCWQYPIAHGSQSLTEAVGNSCNPVFVQLAQRLGIKKYFDYMDLFGVSETTGIDYPGETKSLLQDADTAGPVGLSTMGFGQGIAVSPIQLLTAINAIGNEGFVMQPHIMKKITDSSGDVVKETKATKVRQAISQNTANRMKDIMEYVVSDGGAGNAIIKGYRVGGKTGTSQKYGRESGEVVASFVGMAPMEDPKITVLFIVDNPKGAIYGSTVAAPGAREILAKALRYLNIQPNENSSSMGKKMRAVPNVSGKSRDAAITKLAKEGFKYKVSPSNYKDKNFKVKDQYPKAGESYEKGGIVYLYAE